jgi:hypothetical protein
MSQRASFIDAVHAAQDLPATVREHAGDVIDLRESSFDASYIAFLDEQIRLSPRGPEWSERLARRREALHGFCGVPLLHGRIRTGDSDFTIRVDPKRRAVVHWEQYADDNAEPSASANARKRAWLSFRDWRNMKAPQFLKRDVGAVATTIIVGLGFPVVFLWAGVSGGDIPFDSIFRDYWLALMSAGIYLPNHISSGLGSMIAFYLQGFVIGGAVDMLRWYFRRHPMAHAH